MRICLRIGVGEVKRLASLQAIFPKAATTAKTYHFFFVSSEFLAFHDGITTDAASQKAFSAIKTYWNDKQATKDGARPGAVGFFTRSRNGVN